MKLGEWIKSKFTRSPKLFRVWGEGTEEDFVRGLAAGRANSSGVDVSKETALRYSPFWRGARMIATDVAKLPLLVFQRTPDGKGKDRTTTHPAHRLLSRQSNTELSAFRFRRLITIHALVSGNGYAFIERNGAGAPTALIPLMPEDVMPRRAENGSPLFYELTDGLQSTRLDPVDVLHIDGCGWDGIQGWDTVGQGRDTLGLGIAARDYGGRFFANGAHAGLAVSHPAALRDTAAVNIRESIDRQIQGVSNAHRTLVLEEGMKPFKITDTAEDAQLTEVRVMQIREVANLLGIPSRMLGDPEPQSYNSLEQDRQQYLTDSLDGWLCAWEAEANNKLLTPRQQAADSHVIEFVREALVRAALLDRMNAYQIAIMNGILMPNEARARENRNPVEGGDQLFMAANVVPIDEAGMPASEPPPVVAAPEPEEDDPDEVDDARARLLDQASHRLFSRLWGRAMKAAKQPEKFVGFVDDAVSSEHDNTVDILEPALAVSWPGTDASDAAHRVLGSFRKVLLEVAGQAKADTLIPMLEGEQERVRRTLRLVMEPDNGH